MLTKQLQTKIAEKLEEFNSEVFVVDAVLIKGERRRLIINVDTENGISMAECASLSRQLARWLETHKSFDFSYNLEVSSPGIGSPLKLHRQYVKNIGRNLRIKMKKGEQQEGCLLAVGESGIELGPAQRTKGKKKRKKKSSPIPSSKVEPEPAIRKILFVDIEESKVIITI